MFQTSYGMAMEKMCEYPSSDYSLPHWKSVLHCYAQYTWIYLPIPESDQQYSNVSPTIQFHVYQQIGCCDVHGGYHFIENKQCKLCETYIYEIVT